MILHTRSYSSYSSYSFRLFDQPGWLVLVIPRTQFQSAPPDLLQTEPICKPPREGVVWRAVGLFGKAAQREREQIEQLRAARRGRLSAELWDSDPSEQAYIDEALQIDLDWAGALREMRSPEAVPQPAAWWIENMLTRIQYWDMNEVALAPESGYVLSGAETWAELDPTEIDRLIDSVGEAAARHRSSDFSSPNVRQVFAVLGAIRLKPVPEAEPIYEYVVGQTSYGRLDCVRDHTETLNSVFLPEMTDEQREIYERSFQKAWHLGVVLEVFDRLGRLPDHY